MFKEYHMERQQIPPFPAGYRFVETVEYGSEGVHPCICPLDAVSERQKLCVQKIFLIVIGMIVEVNVRNDSGAVTLSSEIIAIKSCIGIEENAVNGNVCVFHHSENLVERCLNLMHIMVFAGLWLRNGDRNALTVSDKYCVGSLCRLVCRPANFLSTAPCHRMAAVKVGTGEVYLVAVTPKQGLPAFLPRTVLAPLPKLPENCFIMEDYTGEDCLGGNHMPLTAPLEFIQDALDDLAKVSFAFVASFSGCHIRQNFHPYSVFIYEFYQFKECLGVFFLITLNTPYCILYV